MGRTATLYKNGVAVTNQRRRSWRTLTGQPLLASAAPFLPLARAAGGVAMYSSALSPARLAAHYTAATTAPATYVTTVQADSPVLYYRFREPSNHRRPISALWAARQTGLFQVGIAPGGAGPTRRLPGLRGRQQLRERSRNRPQRAGSPVEFQHGCADHFRLDQTLDQRAKSVPPASSYVTPGTPMRGSPWISMAA